MLLFLRAGRLIKHTIARAHLRYQCSVWRNFETSIKEVIGKYGIVWQTSTYFLVQTVDEINIILTAQTAIGLTAVCTQSSIMSKGVWTTLRYLVCGWNKGIRVNRDTMNINKIYRGGIVKIRNSQYWLSQFRNGNLSLEDRKRAGDSLEFDDELYVDDDRDRFTFSLEA